MTNLKIEIERAIFDLELQPIINTMIDQAIKSKSLNECFSKFIALDKSMLIELGKGGSHIWVSIKNKRILLITNR
tara:strand:+ start:7451 stop:7675 length:225 start_codon:yes stop_codon:yes gene_type:complete